MLQFADQCLELGGQIGSHCYEGDQMDIDDGDIEIERQDCRIFCGTLVFRHEGRREALTWTVEWSDSPEVMVEFFNGTSRDVTDLVREHQKPLIDKLLDTLMKRVGRETLFP